MNLNKLSDVDLEELLQDIKDEMRRRELLALVSSK